MHGQAVRWPSHDRTTCAAGIWKSHAEGTATTHLCYLVKRAKDDVLKVVNPPSFVFLNREPRPEIEDRHSVMEASFGTPVPIEHMGYSAAGRGVRGARVNLFC